MKLYVCYGTFSTPRPGGHPCGNAAKALREAGYDPQIIKSYGAGMLPGIFNRTSGRQEVERLTGNRMVPTLVLDDGTVVDGSHEIVAWAQAHPAGAQAA
jgi:Glutathione S-transferase, N-terminal domain